MAFCLKLLFHLNKKLEMNGSKLLLGILITLFLSPGLFAQRVEKTEYQTLSFGVVG